MEHEALDDIRMTVEELDSKVPKDGAAVQFTVPYGAGEQVQVEANKLGYLRLGIEFLKAAFAPPGEVPQSIDANIDYLTTDKSEMRIICFLRMEDLKPPTPPGKSYSIKDRLLMVGCALAACVFFFLVACGVLFCYRLYTGG